MAALQDSRTVYDAGGTVSLFRPTLQKLQLMPDQDFERLIRHVLEEIFPRYRVEATPPGADGGVDLTLVKNFALGGQELFVVQAKRYKQGNNVGIACIRRRTCPCVCQR